MASDDYPGAAPFDSGRPIESGQNPIESGQTVASLRPTPVAVATAHPSSVLRSRQREVDFSALVNDLRVARELLESL